MGFILDASNCGERGGGRLSKGRSYHRHAGGESFCRWGWGERVGMGQRGSMQEQQSALSVIFKCHQWSGQPHLALSAVNLPLQGQFVLAQGIF